MLNSFMVRKCILPSTSWIFLCGLDYHFLNLLWYAPWEYSSKMLLAAFFHPCRECLISSHQILHAFVFHPRKHMVYFIQREFLSGTWEARISCFKLRLSGGKYQFLKISVIQCLIMKIFLKLGERKKEYIFFFYSSSFCSHSSPSLPWRKKTNDSLAKFWANTF